MRRLFSAKVPNSSSAEVRLGLLIEPNPHGKWRWKSREWKGRWKRRWRVESRGSKSIKTTTSCGWNMDDVRARHLSQCHVRNWNVCCETLENVTCEGVLFTLPVGCSCTRSDYNHFFKTQKLVKNSSLSFLMSECPKQVPFSLRPLISWAQRSLTFFNLWAPPVFTPLPPWGTGWRRRRMPPLILITENWFKSLLLRIHGGDGPYL